MICSVIFVFNAVRKEPIAIDKVLPDKEGLRSILLLFVYMILFAITVPYAGFTIANALMLFLMFRGYFKWYYNLLISTGISIFLYWAFVIWLTVPLPVNVFGW